MSDKIKYLVHRSMQSGSESFERGDTRELTEIEAAPLLESGAISLPGEKPATRTAGVQHTFGAAEGGSPLKLPEKAPAAKPKGKAN